jgi:sortase (surface protein transpeptidase)
MEGHGIIYHAYYYEPQPLSKRVRATSSLAKIVTGIAKGMAIGGILILLASYAPSVWYGLIQASPHATAEILAQPVAQSGQSFNVVDKTYQPRFDPKLPLESRLKIPSLGVDTIIQEATADNYEEALKKGTWRVSDFGSPADRSLPTILTAHRYGYLAWSNSFRRKNSFYNLPKLKVGDTVEIYWKQRKYVYEVYAQGEGEAISDYSADLILYTCETLNSPIRVFEYARLLEI